MHLMLKGLAFDITTIFHLNKKFPLSVFDKYGSRKEIFIIFLGVAYVSSLHLTRVRIFKMKFHPLKCNKSNFIFYQVFFLSRKMIKVFKG